MTRKKSDESTPSEAKPRSPRKKTTSKKTATKATPEKRAKPRAAKRPAATPATEPIAATATGRPAAARRKPTHQEIAARAREIWREKGGTAFENWIEAERELEKG